MKEYMPNGGRILSNEHQPAILYVKFTGAADVEANGYTVNDGTEVVSAVTRTAEGKLKIAFRKAYPALLAIDIIHSGLAKTVTIENNTLTTPSDPHIDLEVQSVGTTPADVDPDSVVFYAAVHVKNNNA